MSLEVNSSDAPARPAESGRVPWVSVARDLSIAAATALVWWLQASETLAGRAQLAASVAAGVLLTIVGFLVHEWGHLAGSLATNSRVHFPNRVAAPLLFHFEVEHNDRRQFLWMSYGGYAGSLVGLALIGAVARPEALSGKIALALAGLGTLATFIAEVPTTIRVARGAPMPNGYAFKAPSAPQPKG